MSVLVLGRQVSLVPGATEDADRYGRLLRYVDVGSRGRWAVVDRRRLGDRALRQPRRLRTAPATRTRTSARTWRPRISAATPTTSPDRRRVTGPAGLGGRGRRRDRSISHVGGQAAPLGRPTSGQGGAGPSRAPRPGPRASPSPRLLDARTRRYFVDPSARPTQMCCVASGPSSTGLPGSGSVASGSSKISTWYPVTGSPPSFSGAFQLRVTDSGDQADGLRIARRGRGTRPGSRRSSSSRPSGSPRRGSPQRR